MILPVLASLFVVLNVLAPIASTKISVLGGLSFATGSLLIGMAYICLDVVNELDGRKVARAVVVDALVVRILVFALVVPLVVLLPTKSEPDGFDAWLGGSVRLFIAGWISLYVSAWWVNTILFTRWRDRWKGRWFVARVIGVSLPTYLVSTIVYVLVGWLGTPTDLFSLIVGTVVVRMVVSLVGAPVGTGIRAAAVRYG